jgi:DNA-binding IclR family transcriptional regulator
MPINPSPGVQRAGHVLWYLAEHPSKAHSVSEVARILKIPRATCDSILQALTQQGFVNRRDGEMGYELGASCLALASAAQVANTELNMANRQAEELARELKACVVVSTVINGETRAVTVFDRGPATMFHARVGQTVPLSPPFGVVFAAWDIAASERWLRQAGSTWDQTDEGRWERALEFARQNGYSYSVYTPSGPQFGHVLDELVQMPDSEQNRRARDELVDQLRRSEYLATRIDYESEVRVIQVTAPVFDTSGAVAASIMVVGSMRLMAGADIEHLGHQAAAAAERATTLARGLRWGEPASVA